MAAKPIFFSSALIDLFGEEWALVPQPEGRDLHDDTAPCTKANWHKNYFSDHTCFHPELVGWKVLPCLRHSLQQERLRTDLARHVGHSQPSGNTQSGESF